MKGQRIQIPVWLMEFQDGGNTIWIQGENGTVLRIKVTGKITTEACKVSLCSHCDIVLNGDLKICLSRDAKVES